ncbi:MAG TPA: alpha/beta hydrolase [Acetobacteraceae bacterium]
MPALTRYISAWDGLTLAIHRWGEPDDPRTPILGLPGLVRTAGDFAALAARMDGRRVIGLDYAGRGASGRARHVARYRPEACLRDVMDICAALHLHRVAAVGTSFGGLLAMGLAVTRPGLLERVVLNDVGPEIGVAGTELVRRLVAHDPALPDIEACAAYLRALLPDLSLRTDAEWREFAALTYAPGADGRWHPLWDTRIAGLLGEAPPDLWPLFGALAGTPTLLVHGGRSTLLETATVARMAALRPDMAICRVQDVGHAPTLEEPEAVAALAGFLA